MSQQITIHGARLHNLKNISLSIPKNQIVVFTGLSGSGKSTLGFDILHKEGQRQYLKSLGFVTWGLTRPPVNSISGLSPTISVDQHLSNRSPRSTVGTVTEVFTYLRVLFARLGHRPCPRCGKDVPPPVFENIEEWENDAEGGEPAEMEESTPCPHCGAPVPAMGMAHFSFNKPAGACPTCTGLGVVRQVVVERLINPELSIAQGAISGWEKFHIQYYDEILENAGLYYGFDFDTSKAVKDYTPVQLDLLLYGVDSPRFSRHFPGVKAPTTNAQGRFEGVATNLLRRYDEHAENLTYREKLDVYFVTQPCADCEGTRLRPESRVVTVAGRTIIEVERLPLNKLGAWLKDLPASLSSGEMLIARPILDDLNERVERLLLVGVGYLTLERASPSLSAGEAQRLRLAALLGSGLTGVLYVLDEPTIGLHPAIPGG